jgi:LPS-assembly protein
MKNRITFIFIILIFNLSSVNIANGDEFTFRVTDLEILENNTVYKGNNRGKIISDTQVELISDNFIYLKEINRLETNGNVELTDIKSNTIIKAEKMFYLKSEEIIYTQGKTFINVNNEYNIEGYDLKLLKNKMILSSDQKATVIDNNFNIYKLDQFQYSINEEILKGKNINFTRKEKANKEDLYFFETGFFNLKENKFLGKDVSVKFHKTLFDNKKNDPRVNAVSGYGNNSYTYLDKAVFTSCKKTDKCPPWKMVASEMEHDKAKKQITYKNAWLELYDFPVAYFPKFFHPDPSVKRQSGLLRPEIGNHEILGDSIYLPYFFIISDNKDITLKPRLFNDNKFILQSEYRQITNTSLTIIDSSITKGHDSSEIDKGDSRSHFFANTKIDVNLKNFINSDLEINYEKVSNDNYLKLFDFLKSPLLLEKSDVLETSIRLDLENINYNFSTSVEMYETLSGKNTDRYQYILPTYNFSKNFNLNQINGNFLFDSYGDNTLRDTNVKTSTIINNLNFSSTSTFFDNGIVKNFEVYTKNLNSIGKNTIQYKNSPQSELIGTYGYNLSMPLQKKDKKTHNTLIPKASFLFNPHDMKNHTGTDRKVNVDNVFSLDRLRLGDTFESGESLILGVDFIKQNKNVLNKNMLNEIIEIKNYFDFKLATVFRLKEERNIPTSSTLGKKTSNIFGQMNFNPNKTVSLNYNFSLNNDLNYLEYNSITTSFNFNNFSTQFNFLEERGVIGNTNVVDNITSYNFDEYNAFSFATRRNRKHNLTEYYDLIYEYKNDCLIADIKYRKDYYKDSDIIPNEILSFSITIIPFYTYSPNKMILNKDRVN